MSEEKINDGGHAFPPGIAVDHAGDTYHGPYGMSLRDWFAGQALPAIIAADGMCYVEREIDGHAMLAYRQADAMLKAREVRS